MPRRRRATTVGGTAMLTFRARLVGRQKACRRRGRGDSRSTASPPPRRIAPPPAVTPTPAVGSGPGDLADRGYAVDLRKDFTSTLTMRPENKSEVLSALRAIYDGKWTRFVGTDGGKPLHWAGKLGLVFGCTGAIDTQHSAATRSAIVSCCRGWSPARGNCGGLSPCRRQDCGCGASLSTVSTCCLPRRVPIRRSFPT